MPFIQECQETWNRIATDGLQALEHVVETDFKHPLTRQHYMTMHTFVYSLATHPNVEVVSELYQHYHDYVRAFAKKACHVLSSLPNEEMATCLVEKVWHHYKDVYMIWWTRFFHYLNRFHISRTKKKNLSEIATEQFFVHILTPLQERILTTLTMWMNKERDNGERIHHKHIQDIAMMFVHLNPDIYNERIETAVLETTHVYYAREREIRLVACDEYNVRMYMVYAVDAIDDEEKRIGTNTDERIQETQTKLIRISEDELIKQPQETLLQVLPSYVQNEDKDALHNMFCLLKRVDQLEILAKTFQLYVQKQGILLLERIAGEEKSEKGLIPQLLEFHNTYHQFIKTCFQSHTVLEMAYRRGMMCVCNHNIKEKNKYEWVDQEMAMYCDCLLRGETKQEDDVVDAELEQVAVLFDFLGNKDVFAEYYRKLLAKRLMMQRTIGDESEKAFISHLKVQAGVHYTSKLEGMCNDMQLSKDLSEAYNTYQETNSAPTRSNIRVLTTGYWPATQTDDIILPSSLEQGVHHFATFYASRTQHRILRWVHSLGQVQMKMKVAKRAYDITVNTYQATVLMMFLSENKHSIQEIQEATNISLMNLRPVLASLSSSKYPLLIRENTSSFNAKDMYTFNEQFKSKQMRFRIPTMVRLTTEEHKEIRTNVTVDRTHSIEAAIVRLMKTNQEMTHTNLMTETSQHLFNYFTPDPKNIKQSIEHLIEREYMERHADNRNVYIYVA